MSKTAFNLTKIRGIAFDVDGVLSPSTVPLGDDGIPRRMANLKDGLALREAVKQGLHVAIISGASAPGITKRYNLLGISDIYLGVGKKSEVLAEWLSAKNLTSDQIAFVGDDLPDCECMRLAALGVAPADASADALRCADYISPVMGGYGVARDILEQILRAQNRWPESTVANG